jgi:acyl-CoA synthetase (AMP-forming)/AMP-acid ligase II
VKPELPWMYFDLYFQVKGFQVAPAELEGTLLYVLVHCSSSCLKSRKFRDHPDVSDTCVVGIPDEYSLYPPSYLRSAFLIDHAGGEVPLAFVVLTVDAAARVKTNPRLLEETRASLLKVSDS